MVNRVPGQPLMLFGLLGNVVSLSTLRHDKPL